MNQPIHHAIWDEALSDNLTMSRINAVKAWSSGMDREVSYSKNIINANNKRHITYKPLEFSYQYNSMGIRCNEIKKEDVEILYAGCSFTEGEGLPVEHIWAHQLNEMIQEKHGRKFGYYNIGRGGSSVAAIARYIYHAIEVIGMRPKMVVVLFPSIFRDEFYVDNFPPHSMYNPIHYIPNFIHPDSSRAQKYFYENYEKNIRITNSINDFYRNLILVEAVCAKYGIEFAFDTWQHTMNIDELSNSDLDRMNPKYLIGPKKQILNLGAIINEWMPTNLKDKYLNIRWLSNEEVVQKYPQTIARDFAHPGPNPHHNFATYTYHKIKPVLNKIYEQSNQHQIVK